MNEINGKNTRHDNCFDPASLPDRLTTSVTITSGGVIMTGEQLKAKRISKHLTQKQLGLMLGYGERSAEKNVQQWEYGNRPIPTKHWKALTKILGVKLEEFLPE